MGCRFLEPLREAKIASRYREFEKSGVKLQRSTEGRERTFVSIYREARENEGSKNRDSTVYLY